MTTDATSNFPNSGINNPARQPRGSQRRLRERLFAIGWAASVIGATFVWLYILERAISYSLNWL